MNYAEIIEQIYEHLENGHVDKATMKCLRLSRNSKDYLSTAIFLRELHPDEKRFLRILYEDINLLKKEAQKFFVEQSWKEWLETHTLPFSIGKDYNVLAVGIGEIDRDIEQHEKTIEDMTIPSGMGAYDTAFFTDKYNQEKAQIRLCIKALYIVKGRIKTRCFNYAIQLEKQIQAQVKSVNFLQETQNEVNNYFKTNASDVYIKLQKASRLINSTAPENYSLILTLVRRAIKSVADYFYPPVAGEVVCFDGKKRILGNAQYLNRLQEYMVANFAKTSSNKLLQAELDNLGIFTHRLNEIASKGVHSDSSVIEAKQGLIGLYMFLFNVISKLQQQKNP